MMKYCQMCVGKRYILPFANAKFGNQQFANAKFADAKYVNGNIDKAYFLIQTRIVF